MCFTSSLYFIQYRLYATDKFKNHDRVSTLCSCFYFYMVVRTTSLFCSIELILDKSNLEPKTRVWGCPNLKPGFGWSCLGLESLSTRSRSLYWSHILWDILQCLFLTAARLNITRFILRKINKTRHHCCWYGTKSFVGWDLPQTPLEELSSPKPPS